MEKKSLTVRILVFVLIMAVIIIMMTIVSRGSSTSGKYDSFAVSLKDKGAQFYGAFWCPHCQEQEKWLDASRQKLESEGLYVECSTPTANGQTQICIDKKIESYPTWMFQNGIRIPSDTPPITCDISPGKPGEDPECAKAGSQFFKRWIFADGFVIASPNEPTVSAGVWSFDQTAQLRGETSLANLAELTGAVLPSAQ